MSCQLILHVKWGILATVVCYDRVTKKKQGTYLRIILAFFCSSAELKQHFLVEAVEDFLEAAIGVRSWEAVEMQ